MTSITVSQDITTRVLTEHDDFAPYRTDRLWRDLTMNAALLSDDALRVLADEYASISHPRKADKATAAIIDALLRVRGGADDPVRSLAALPNMLAAWVDATCERGWLVRRDPHDTGRDQAWLVTDVYYRESDNRGGQAHVSVHLTANAPGGRTSRDSHRRGDPTDANHISLSAEDLMSASSGAGKRRRLTVPEILANKGWYAPTDADLDAHDRTAERFETLLATGFAQQFRHTGAAVGDDWGHRDIRNDNAKVIHDVAPGEVAPAQPIATVWGSATADEPVVRPLPIVPTLRVFDLARQVFVTVDTRDLTEHVYDTSLQDKLILPATHRDLLDVLTSDLADYADDIIEGKSAGNVILAQGRPGVGKTLTAEVYAELVQRPLYAIHSGSLGINAESVRKNLETIFARAARWDAVLLLDEADVFVVERGGSIEQNAIVAEFLRTLEYFKGLLFMTTNRSDSIDDAILSRCAAIITYGVPDRDDARKVWDVMVANANAQDLVPDSLIEELLDTYPHLAPRDIKMVLRLALRISAKRGTSPDMATFANCILFRGLTNPDSSK